MDNMDDITTTRIGRAVSRALNEASRKAPSGEWSLDAHLEDHERRIHDLEEIIDKHTTALADGRVLFERIDGVVKLLAEKMGFLTTAAWWLIGTFGLGFLTSAGGAFIWVLQHMGAKS